MNKKAIIELFIILMALSLYVSGVVMLIARFTGYIKYLGG
jgi:hypothetical protein